MRKFLVSVCVVLAAGMVAGVTKAGAVCFCAWQANQENGQVPPDDRQCPTTSSSANGGTYSSVPNIICDTNGDGQGTACYTNGADCRGTVPPTPTPLPVGVIQGCTVGTPIRQTAYMNGVPIPTMPQPGNESCFSNSFQLNPGGVNVVSVGSLPGFSIGYTLCYDDTGCHKLVPVPGLSTTVVNDFINGNFVAGQDPFRYADLWWHYTPPACNIYGVGSPLSFTPNDAQFGFTNYNATAKTLRSLNINWNDNGDLHKLAAVKMGSVLVWNDTSGGVTSPFAIGPTNWVFGADRTIAAAAGSAGTTRSLVLSFNSQTGDTYSVTPEWDNGSGGEVCGSGAVSVSRGASPTPAPSPTCMKTQVYKLIGNTWTLVDASSISAGDSLRFYAYVILNGADSSRVRVKLSSVLGGVKQADPDLAVDPVVLLGSSGVYRTNPYEVTGVPAGKLDVHVMGVSLL